MTSNKLNVRTRSSAFLSVLLVTCLHTPAAVASNSVYFSSNTMTIDEAVLEAHTNVDAAPDVPLNAEQLAQIPDATPVAEPLSPYGNASLYGVLGKSYTVMAKAKKFKQVGMASWYGKQFHGKRTSSGERFDMYKLTAAHKNLPIPCYVRVTNTENGKSVIVKVNDRGPFHGSRVMDVSWAAAAKLDMIGTGTAKIKLEVLSYEDTAIAAIIPEKAIAAVIPSQFFVQVGSFSTQDNALNLQSKLSELVALPIEVSTTESSQHKVQIGPFVDETTANKARDYVLQVAALNPIIVKR